jgi:hypothetical protein
MLRLEVTMPAWLMVLLTLAQSLIKYLVEKNETRKAKRKQRKRNRVHPAQNPVNGGHDIVITVTDRKDG